MFTLYNVISADGYIMTKEGDESFIPDSLWPTVLGVFKQYEVFLMGKRTYEAFQNYGDHLLKPFEELSIRKVVVSRDESFQPKSGYEAVTDPREVIKEGRRTLVSSGPGFNNYLFENKLIDTIIFHRLREVLGEGIKPFEDKFMNDFQLKSHRDVDGAEELVYGRNKNT